MYFHQASYAANATPCRLRSRSRRHASAAFTLLELLLVLAILVVLGGVVLVNFSGTQDSSNVQATQIQAKEIGTAIVAYRIKMNGLPKSLDELKDGPSDAAKKARWTDSILKEIPKDAWGTEFEYSAKGNTYELRSAGLDGQMNSEDDIVQTGP